MASLHVDDDDVVITLRPSERIAGLLRDQRVPVAAIEEVAVESAPFAAMHGMRAPGLAVPGRRRIGTWRGQGRRTFVSVRADQPAVRLRTDGSTRYDEYLIGIDDADQVVAAITGRRAP